MPFRVVGDAVLEDLADVGGKRLRGEVLAVVHLGLDSAEVHRLLDDVMIVVKAYVRQKMPKMFRNAFRPLLDRLTTT